MCVYAYTYIHINTCIYISIFNFKKQELEHLVILSVLFHSFTPSPGRSGGARMGQDISGTQADQGHISPQV